MTETSYSAPSIEKCPYCHGDKELAIIAWRMGHRPDIAFAEIRRLNLRIKQLEACIARVSAKYPSPVPDITR